MGVTLLLIGHFFGDFTLQTNKIALMKKSSDKWLLLHVFIVTLSTLILSIPMGMITMILVLINGAIHFSIDWYKLHKFNREDRTVLYFFIDQFVHIAILVFISLVPNKMTGIGSTLSLRWILCILLTMSVVNIITQFFLQEVYGKDRPFFYKNEIFTGHVEKILILVNVAIYSVNFYGFLVFLFLLAFMSPLISSRYVKENLSLRYFQHKFLINYILIAICYFVCI